MKIGFKVVEKGEANKDIIVNVLLEGDRETIEEIIAFIKGKGWRVE